MLRIGTTVIGVDDVGRAYRFWQAALGYRPRHAEPAPEVDWVILDPPDGTGASIALGLSDTPAQSRPRLHLDLYAGDAADQAQEVERLVALGAQRVAWSDYPPDADFVVLADTEGNRFCVIDTSVPPPPMS